MTVSQPNGSIPGTIHIYEETDYFRTMQSYIRWKMKSEGNDGYRERTYAVSSGNGTRIGSGKGIQVMVLEEAPNLVEVWSKTFVLGEYLKAVLTMQVVDGQVVEKCVSLKSTWHPETIAHEV
jgi:hypothetical protein